MDKIRIQKADLLKKLQENREAHLSIFNDALVGFEKVVTKALETRLEMIRNRRRIDLSIRLDEPVNQTADYDRVIAMLHMSLDDEILLSEADFRAYVMDDWAWKKNFSTVNSQYTGSPRS